jgi:hypothetical protein
MEKEARLEEGKDPNLREETRKMTKLTKPKKTQQIRR